MSAMKIPSGQICIKYKKNSTFLHNIFLEALDQLSDFLVKMIFSLSFSFPLAQLSWGKSMLAIDLKLSRSGWFGIKLIKHCCTGHILPNI